MIIKEPVRRRQIIHRDPSSLWIDIPASHETLECSGKAELDAFMEDVMLFDAGAVIFNEMENQCLHEIFRGTCTCRDEDRLDTLKHGGGEFMAIVDEHRLGSRCLGDLREPNRVR